jgi:tight adherence protein B
MSAGAVWGPGLLAGAVVVVLAWRAAPWTTSPPRIPAAAAAVAGRQSLGRSWWRRPGAPARRAVDDESVAAWCERVAGGIRGGSSLTRAVLEADVRGARPSPFPDVVHAIQRGRPLADAFRSSGGDPSTPLGLAAPVLATCADLGGPAAPALERVASVLLGRSAERAERRAAGAQARLSARVLTLVPLAVVVVLLVTEPSVRATFGTPAGMACLAVGGTLDLAGWWWMHRMIGGAS